MRSSNSSDIVNQGSTVFARTSEQFSAPGQSQEESKIAPLLQRVQSLQPTHFERELMDMHAAEEQ
jgi:hypothetical protein